MAGKVGDKPPNAILVNSIGAVQHHNAGHGEDEEPEWDLKKPFLNLKIKYYTLVCVDENKCDGDQAYDGHNSQGCVNPSMESALHDHEEIQQTQSQIWDLGKGCQVVEEVAPVLRLHVRPIEFVIDEILKFLKFFYSNFQRLTSYPIVRKEFHGRRTPMPCSSKIK